MGAVTWRCVRTRTANNPDGTALQLVIGMLVTAQASTVFFCACKCRKHLDFVDGRVCSALHGAWTPTQTSSHRSG